MLIFDVLIVHVGNAGDCIGRLAGAESGARPRGGEPVSGVVSRSIDRNR